MKYYKFEKIEKGKYPIIKVTFKTWWGKKVVRDICRPHNNWYFMDNGSVLIKDEPIKTFYHNNSDIYFVN